MADRVVALLLLLVSGWVFYDSARWPADLFIGGPAMMPRILAGILAVQAVLLGARPAPAGAGEEGPVHAGRVAAGVAVAFAYYWAIPRLGFVSSSLAALALLQALMGERRWLRMVALSAAFVSVTYVVFGILLHIPFPEGALL